jgi:hypothetical protein
MTDVATNLPTSTGSGTAPSQGLLGRVVGVIFSPRETYQGIAAHPRVLGALLLVLIISVGATTAFLFTEVGQNALFDQQLLAMESFGMRISDEMYDNLESQLQWSPYFAGASQLVFIPGGWAVLSGLLLGFFNAIMGGDATFKQVYAIVAHAGVLVALQQLFVLPLNYARESLSSPTSLAVFFPFLDETSFLSMLLGGINLFFIWLIVNLAIGIGVLYKKKTAPIALTMMAVYFSVMLVVAAVRASFSGA